MRFCLVYRHNSLTPWEMDLTLRLCCSLEAVLFLGIIKDYRVMLNGNFMGQFYPRVSLIVSWILKVLLWALMMLFRAQFVIIV